MQKKTLVFSLLGLLILVGSSCGPSPEPTTTNAPPPTAAPTETPFYYGPCDPSTEQIEINTRLTKGVGSGYTPPGKICAVYCIHVPDGSQLTIGIADLEYQLNFTVGRILFPHWDPALQPHRGMLAGNKRMIVNPRNKFINPSGRYYVYVCLNEGSGEFWDDGKVITYQNAVLFSLYNEFIP